MYNEMKQIEFVRKIGLKYCIDWAWANQIYKLEMKMSMTQNNEILEQLILIIDKLIKINTAMTITLHCNCHCVILMLK